MTKNKIIAIIPARGGSKRIKNKNIIKILGKPMIAHSINIAKSSNVFDEIIVSTDSKKIEKISQKYGAKVYRKRPRKLSNDYASLIDVVKCEIKFLKKKIDFDVVCCLLPTALLIDDWDIKKSLNDFKKKRFEFLFSATRLNKNILRSFSITDKKLKMIFPKNYKKRTQDLIDIFLDSGKIYWANKTTWMRSNRIFSRKSGIYLLPENKGVDIDTYEDLKKVKKLIKERYPKS